MLPPLPNNSTPLWHYKMVNDETRNKVFREAINQSVNNDTIVLEIGTGAGLLALYAVKAGAKHVYTVEGDPIIANYARKIIDNNGFSDKITVINKFSSNLTSEDLNGNLADIIISETIGDAILNEKLILNIKDALSFAKEDAIILPNDFRICFGPVDMSGLREHFEVNKVDGFDLSPFNELAPTVFFPVEPLEDWRFKDLHATEFFDIKSFSPTKLLPNYFTLSQDSLIDGLAFWGEFSVGDQILSTRPTSYRNAWHTMYLKSPRVFLPEGSTIPYELEIFNDRFFINWTYKGL